LSGAKKKKRTRRADAARTASKGLSGGWERTRENGREGGVLRSAPNAASVGKGGPPKPLRRRSGTEEPRLRRNRKRNLARHIADEGESKEKDARALVSGINRSP